MRVVILFLVILLGACSRVEEPLVVSFDELVSHPHKFNGKDVVVDGVLAMGFEAMFLQHPTDRTHPSRISYDYASFPKEQSEERGFDMLIDAFARAPNKGEWKTEPIVRARVAGSFSHTTHSGQGFGHLGGSPSQIVIYRVLEAKPYNAEAEPGDQHNAGTVRR